MILYQHCIIDIYLYGLFVLIVCVFCYLLLFVFAREIVKVNIMVVDVGNPEEPPWIRGGKRSRGSE